MTTTQPSDAPLPLPMRVSAGFLVTDLSGKTRMKTLPPRRTKRVITRRAPSDRPVVPPARFGGLQAELAERQVGALGGDAGPPASMELAIFDAGGEQHLYSFFLAARGARGVFGAAGLSVVVARARVVRLGAGVSPPSAAGVAFVARGARCRLAGGAAVGTAGVS